MNRTKTILQAGLIIAILLLLLGVFFESHAFLKIGLLTLISSLGMSLGRFMSIRYEQKYEVRGR